MPLPRPKQVNNVWSKYQEQEKKIENSWGQTLPFNGVICFIIYLSEGGVWSWELFNGCQGWGEGKLSLEIPVFN